MAKKFLFGAVIVLASVASADAGMLRDPSGGSDLVTREFSFLDGLHGGYVTLSRSRAGASDWIDAERFKLKAMHAEIRVSVFPDEVMGRNLPAADAAELKAALSRLRASYSPGGRRLTPAQAAKAHVAYECWIEAAEVPPRADVARCKGALEQEIVRIEGALAQRPSQEALTAPAQVPQGSGPAPNSTPPAAPTPYVVLFAFDSADLSAAAKRAVTAAVAKADGSSFVDFSITGHADTAGPEQYNLDLSLRRANAVRDALMARGVKSNGISVAGRGETEPAVPTDDDVPEAANRRVEIIFF